MYKSKTIVTNSAIIAGGAVICVSQWLDVLEVILKAIDLDALPPDIATWVGVGLAIIGSVNIGLRMVTTGPVDVSFGRSK